MPHIVRSQPVDGRRWTDLIIELRTDVPGEQYNEHRALLAWCEDEADNAEFQHGKFVTHGDMAAWGLASKWGVDDLLDDDDDVKTPCYE